MLPRTIWGGSKNAIYADAMGFAEQVPTKRFWGELFNLGKTRTFDGWRAFSGYKSSVGDVPISVEIRGAGIAG